MDVPKPCHYSCDVPPNAGWLCRKMKQHLWCECWGGHEFTFSHRTFIPGEWQDRMWVHSVMYLHPLFHASCIVKDFSSANTQSRSRQCNHESPTRRAQGHAERLAGAGQEVTLKRSCLCKHSTGYEAGCFSYRTSC